MFCQAGGTTRRSLVKDLLGNHAPKDDIVTVGGEEAIKAVAATAFLGVFSAVTVRSHAHTVITKVEQKL